MVERPPNFNLIKRYRVWGEYGPVAATAIERTYRAHSSENARKRFIREIRSDHPVQWRLMGEHNVYADEL